METNCQGRLRRSRRLSRLSRPRQWIFHSLKTPLKLPSREEFVPLMSCSLETISTKKEFVPLVRWLLSEQYAWKEHLVIRFYEACDAQPMTGTETSRTGN